MISSKNGYFVDEKGRILIFKGCNFSADSKIPVIPDGATHKEDSLNRDKISFVGRPCKLEEADEHFERMKKWGFNFLRFLITWEAIEPLYPKVYDKEYIEFIKKILKKAEEYGFYIYIDPHQDIYSRFSGGDGAPFWTFDKVGIDVDKIGPSYAALLHKDYPKNYPSMIWPTNYNRYAAATMFTIFFGGNDFAKDFFVEGQNVQDYLQTRYMDAICELAKELVDNKNIIGFGSMNEPHPGYIGYTDLNMIQNCSYAKGYIPTGFQSMTLASGFPTYINKYDEGFFGYKPIGRKLFNKDGISIFKEGAICPWRMHGVWDIVKGEPKLLKKDYFSIVNGRKISFANDYLKPFIIKFQNRINNVNPDWYTIIEGIPHGDAPTFSQNQTKKMIHGFHWYDGMPMVLKVFSPFFSIRGDTRKPVFGKKNIINSYFEQLRNMKENTEKNMGNMPVLLGEFGLPFDIFKGISFKTKSFKIQNSAISMFFDAIDKLLISSTIWTYCVNNNHRWGDNWNKEDFSIYCKEDSYIFNKEKNYKKENRSETENYNKKDNHNFQSKRAIDGFLRPYPIATNGIPISFNFNQKTKRLFFNWTNENNDFIFNQQEPTVIFIPGKLYQKGFDIILKREKQNIEEKIEEKDYGIKYDEINQLLYLWIKITGSFILIIDKKA